jgi:predicted component of type VI protein secretion system
MNRKRTGTVVAAAFLLLICLCACQGAETKLEPAQTVPEVQSRTEENPVRQEETQAAESQTPSGQSSPGFRRERERL